MIFRYSNPNPPAPARGELRDGSLRLSVTRSESLELMFLAMTVGGSLDGRRAKGVDDGWTVHIGRLEGVVCVVSSATSQRELALLLAKC